MRHWGSSAIGPTHTTARLRHALSYTSSDLLYTHFVVARDVHILRCPVLASDVAGCRILWNEPPENQMNMSVAEQAKAHNGWLDSGGWLAGPITPNRARDCVDDMNRTLWQVIHPTPPSLPLGNALPL